MSSTSITAQTHVYVRPRDGGRTASWQTAMPKLCLVNASRSLCISCNNGSKTIKCFALVSAFHWWWPSAEQSCICISPSRFIALVQQRPLIRTWQCWRRWSCFCFLWQSPCVGMEVRVLLTAHTPSSTGCPQIHKRLTIVPIRFCRFVGATTDSACAEEVASLAFIPPIREEGKLFHHLLFSS